MLSDEKIDWLLGELDKIEHVEIKRLGTRTPVTLPQRITPELCAILERHHPVYINTHFNTAQEVTPEAAEACARLAKAGVPLGNQAVLLRGINDHPHLMKRLNQALLQIRVRPYYIFHAKCVIGTMHFRARKLGSTLENSQRPNFWPCCTHVYYQCPRGFKRLFCPST